MKALSKDARGFVEGVVSHLKASNTGRKVVPKVESFLKKMSAGAKHEHRATVESAVKLTNAEMQSVTRTLERLTGHEVQVSNEIVPKLVGGIRVTMGDWVMDSSIESELESMARLVSVS